jgi:uncharacterized protein (TIGR02996 family)
MPPSAELLQSFLDGIVAHPDEGERWLILADWLEDHADPRAELVRLTWQLQYESDHADFDQRQARVQALLAGGMVPVWPRRTLAGIEFAWVPPGTFLMGSPLNEPDRQQGEAQHQVTVPTGFWIGVYLITQSQWTAVMGTNPSHYSRQGKGKERVKKIRDADLERFPVEQVSWHHARAFCAWVGLGVTLPSEAQWEYACRAGTRTAFHFGATSNGTEANCLGKYPARTKRMGSCPGRPTVVGTYPPNAWGLHDMHGNVAEWCLDTAPAVYFTRPVGVAPSEEENTALRVLRGGSFNDVAPDCRSASRTTLRPNSLREGLSGSKRSLGFRVIVPCRE